MHRIYYGTARAKDAADAAAKGGGGTDAGASADGDGEGRGAYRFLKSYRVFNADQVEGLDARFHPAPDPDDGQAPSPIPRWQAFFEAASRGAGVPTIFGGDRACYVPALDQVHLPPLERFRAAGMFYSVWHHEMTHATKTKDRLDRSFGVSRFGNDAYAREEMVACLSQVLMDQRMGFGAEHIDDHAAYIGSWLTVLRGDKRFLFTAAAHAQRAVDWIVEAAARGGVALDDPATGGEEGAGNGNRSQEAYHEAA